MLNVFIRDNQIYSKPLEYILSVFAKNIFQTLYLTKNKNDAHLIFDDTDANSRPINIPFFDLLLNKNVFDHRSHFETKPFILFPNSNAPDWLGTAFYLINGFQEYGVTQYGDDSSNYGRFRYADSYQYRFNCIERNIVQECFDQFYNTNLASAGISKINRPSTVFLSHDVDLIYGSFVQDGLWAIHKRRFDILLKLVFNEILLKPHWKNVDKIVRLHTEHDLKSTFFWLATKHIGANGIENADYDVRKITRLIRQSNSNGLHKSCDNLSFTQELNMLPFTTQFNRYHFLKFTLPSAWNDLEEAGITLDASLGFAEHIGFRNSYGLPFSPYNIDTQSAYHFVEVPLHMMDATFHYYMKTPVDNTAQKVIDFIEKHRYNAVLSILWHNMYFTDYAYGGYLKEYRKILAYLVESGIRSTTPEDIIKTFGGNE